MGISDAENIDILVGKRVTALRERRGWTQKDLGKKTGYSQSTIARWEKGKRSLRPYNLAKIARAFGIGAHELMIEKQSSYSRLDFVTKNLEVQDGNAVGTLKRTDDEEILSSLDRIEAALIEQKEAFQKIGEEFTRLHQCIARKKRKSDNEQEC